MLSTWQVDANIIIFKNVGVLQDILFSKNKILWKKIENIF